MKTCKVRKAFKLLAGFQWSEIKIMSSHYVNSSARYKILPLFTRFDGTFQAKEGAAKYVQQQLNLLGNISLPFYYSV